MEGRERKKKELTALWKKISRAWAIGRALGSTEAMRKVGRGRE